MSIGEDNTNSKNQPSLSMSGLQNTEFTPWRDITTNVEPLIKLPTMIRSPHAILQQKMTWERQANDSKETKLNKIIDKDIKLKLSFLNVIQNLKTSSSFRQSSKQISELESKTLLYGLSDRTQQLQEAELYTRQIWEQVRDIHQKLELEEANRGELYRKMTEKKNFQQQSLDMIINKVSQTEIEAERLECLLHEQDNFKEEMVIAPQAIKDTSISSPNISYGCIQFSNLFAISGQLVEFCHGEYGSKFAINRLKNGADPERSLLRTELELPEKLTKHLSNSHCRKVIIALASTDKVSKEELLRQIKDELDVILSLEGGRDFVQEMLNE